MTEPESEHPELTPAQEEAVRRRLVAARHTGALPDAVAERLDRVLVGLADEHKPGRVIAPVADLAVHRRRRAVQLLVAAAAVVAVGFGFGQLSGYGGGNSADTASTAGQFHRSGSPTDSNNQNPEVREPTSPTVSNDQVYGSLPVIRPEHFRADVAAPTSVNAETDTDKAMVSTVCRTAAKGERMLAVAYQGALATLIYHAPNGHVQRVDLYRCDPPDFVRSAVIPDP